MSELSSSVTGDRNADGHAPSGRRLKLTLPQALALIGPAFVAGAWRFGPGALTSAVQAGGQYAYELVWVMVLSTLLMFFFTDMAVRIGLSTPGSLVETTKRTLGRPVGFLAGAGVFAITLMFSVGNAIGAGIALRLLFGGSAVGWTLGCTVAVAVLVLLRDAYKAMERLLIALIALMSVGFMASAILSKPDWGAAAAGVVPHIPSGVGFLLVALVGTNFSINSAFYTGYATRERQLRPEQYRYITLADTIPGTVATGLMTILVIVVAAAVLGATGKAVSNFAQLSQVLQPLAGRAGSILFGLGFFGAAFSSMAANASAGGTLLADAMGWSDKLSSWRVRGLTMIVLAWGAFVTVVAKGSKIELIIIAQALTVLVAPFLGVLLVTLSNRRDIMGSLRSRWWHNIFGVLGLIVIAATCVRLIVKLTS